MYIYFSKGLNVERVVERAVEKNVEQELEETRGAMKEMEVEGVRETPGGATGSKRSKEKASTGGKVAQGVKEKEEISELVKGMRVVEGGEQGVLQVVKGKGMLGEKEVKISEWLGEFSGGIVVREEVVSTAESGRSEVCSNTSVGSVVEEEMFSFLENIEEEGRDEEADRILNEERKRKRGREDIGMSRGLLGTAGWEDRERREKGDERWSRVIEEGEQEWREPLELPDEYRLGLEKRGEEINNSSKIRNGMGTNRRALFPKAGNERGEDKNWLASFNRAGCVACKNDEGMMNHRGRKGEPLVLVIGDEATPTVVGYTKGVEEESGCGWVLKKEHLRLGEVAGMLRRLNEDKKESDWEFGRRPHDFFLPNGSKILVGSYTHLRREGLDGYVEDFAQMVRDVWQVTGDIGVEVLPFVPVVYERLDKEGGLLLSGVKSWIKWWAGQAGRQELVRLSETAGREEEVEGDTVTMFVRPIAVMLKSREKEGTELGMKGNMVSVVKGSRRELRLREALPAKEIMRMTNGGELRKEGELESDEEARRGSFREGVSMEAEYTFVKAVEGFCKEAVKEGRYKGPYL